MDVSVEKGLESLPVNDSNSSIPKSSEIGRIIVYGYDTRLSRDDVEKALRKLYSSCGKITDVYVPKDGRRTISLSGLVLSEDDIEIALKAFLSSYGEVDSILVEEKRSKSSAVVFMCGDNAAVEVLKLSGSVVGGRRLVVTRLSDLGMSNTHPRRPCYRLFSPSDRKKAKTSADC